MANEETTTVSAEDQAAAKAAKDAEKAAKKAAKAAEKAKKKEEAKAAKEAAKQPKQNDVRRPKAGTTTGKVWAIFDSLSQSTGAPALIGDAMKQVAGSIPEATVRTQFARWRKFHGITGRAVAPAATETPAQ